MPGHRGIDSAIFEETIVDQSTGHILNCNMIDYKWRTSLELPPIDNIIMETPFSTHRYRAVGVGGIATSPGPSAVRMMASSTIIMERCGVLAEAALSVGSPQIRNVATLGGNLCQDTRCWYYRYPRHIGGPIRCLRKGKGPCLAVKGDNRYHAILEGKKCFSVCPSDTAVALIALDASLTIIGLKGERSINIKDFYYSPVNALEVDEMVKEIVIPMNPSQNV